MGSAGPGGATFAATQDHREHEHIRTSSTTIAALIQRATERSQTFQNLVQAITASDGMVYIEEGTCSQGMRSCFVNVTSAGPNRLLWVKLHVWGVDCDLMGLIGHELKHAVEVLGDPQVRDFAAMYLFYSQATEGHMSGPPFETIGATRTGEAVREEVRKRSSCASVR